MTVVAHPAWGRTLAGIGFPLVGTARGYDRCAVRGALVDGRSSCCRDRTAASSPGDPPIWTPTGSRMRSGATGSDRIAGASGSTVS